MKTELNIQQQAAVNSTARRTLVSASAGTGKTTVLAQRVLKSINLGRPGDDEKPDVDNLLVLTFTDAAAQNMRERIKKQLREAIDHPLVQADAVQHQLTKLEQADVMTIDAFCKQVIDRYYYLIGMDPEFDVLASESSKLELRTQALDQVLEEFYQSAINDSIKKQFLERLTTEYRDNSLRVTLTALLDFLGSIDDPEAWLAKQNKNNDVFENYQKYYFERLWKDYRNELLQVKNYYHQIFKFYPNNEFGQNMRLATSIIEYLEQYGNLNKFEFCETEFNSVNMRSVYKDNNYSDLYNLLFGQAKNKKDSLAIINHQEDNQELKHTVANVLEQLNQLHKLGVQIEQLDSLIELFNQLNLALDQEKSLTDYQVELLSKLKKDTLKNVLKLDKFSEFVCGSEFKEFNKWINDTLFKGYNHDSLIIKEYKDEFIQNKKWLIKLYRQFKNQYQSIKDRYNLYDFGDLERIVYDLLNSDEHPEVKTELQQQYQQIIVDEYQDTNRLQDTIVTTIAGDQGKLFLVGDVKQSIYGFRNADHTVFVEKEQSYLKDDDADVFHLTVNYRTRPTTIKAINGLFSHIMATDNVNYQGQELTAGISIENRDLPAFEFNQVNHEKGADVTSVEATVVVERVVKLLNEGRVEPKDIAIISRSWSGREEYIKRLKQVGVPYKVTKSNGFLGKYEVMVALAYLKSLYDSTDKISLVAILHAPMYGLTERELAFLKVTVNKSFSLMSPDLIDENQAPKFKITDEELSILRNKLTKFNRDYQFLSKLADVLSASELLQHIFEYTDLLISMTAMPQGEERRANLYGLLDYLLDIEATMETSAQETMATLEATGDLDEINQNADENAVTYTTIHGSKGLEWPVVFVVNTGKKYANESKNNAVVFSRKPDLGIGMSLGLTKSPFKKFVTEDNKLNDILEEKRMMYVALTRAQQSLLIYGNDKNKPSNFNLLASAIDATDFNCNEINATRTQVTDSYHVTDKKNENSMVVETKNYHYQGVNETPQTTPTTKIKDQFNQINDSSEIGVIPTGVDVSNDNDLSDGVSADEFGTAVHLIFEKLSLDSQPTLLTVTELIDQLANEGLISEMVQAELLKPVANNTTETYIDGIVALYQSEIGSSMVQASLANRLEREKTLTMMVKAELISKDSSLPYANDDFTIIHGMIDVLYQQPDGKYVIVDYKTDKNLDADKVMKENYPGQLSMYAQTLGQLGYEVAKCYVYGVRHHQLFDVTVN